MKFKFKLQPRIVIIISVIIGIVMITSAYFELNESRKEIFQVLSEKSSSLIETISLSSNNTLKASDEIENLMIERLLDNAKLIKDLDSLNLLTRKKLIQIGNENKLFRINIFNKKGDRILTNRVPIPGHIHPEGKVNRYKELQPILTGETKQLILGLKNSEFSNEERFAVAISRAFNKGAIVINLDARDFLEFRKKIGIGKIIRDIADKSGIEYIVLQDTMGILAASASVKSMDPIEGDKFLENALNVDSTFKRIIKFNGNEVYEVVKRLEIDNNVIGLFRIGVSLDEVKSVESRMYRRIIIISLILAAISIIVLSIIFTTQNLQTVSNEFGKFRTFTSTILEEMREAVIVINNEFVITLFNKSAEELFKIKRDKVINQNIKYFLNGKFSFIMNEVEIQNNNTSDIQRTVEINNQPRFLSLSITKNLNERNEAENYTIVINDFTERKNLEDNAKRQEKLSAMGELASGVAHEIRNPINAIGMIAQRLDKEFVPNKDSDEYKSILNVLKDEVTRINKIITQFLNYAKPLEIELRITEANEYFEDIYRLYISQSNIRKINFKKLSSDSFKIKIDPELMKQALMNVLQNAIESVNENGLVTFNYFKEDNLLNIIVEDNGNGIPEDQLKRIFDLYYTTKKDGNGLGLSIAQKIINQHSGTIIVESKIKHGTKFIIKIPAV